MAFRAGGVSARPGIKDVASLAFAVASVKPTVPLPGRGTRTKPDGINFEVADLRFCISFAYRVRPYQVVGPAWIDGSYYEIIAKIGPSQDPKKMPEMLQTLLAERFKLQIHGGSKDFSGYALVVDKGDPKFPESTGEDEKRALDAVGNIPPQPLLITEFAPGGVWRLRGIAATMDRLATDLSFRFEAPVVDQTGIKGGHNFAVEGNREDLPSQMASGIPSSGTYTGVSIFTSLRDIGLQLKALKVPLEIIVVDHAERVPTPN